MNDAADIKASASQSKSADLKDPEPRKEQNPEAVPSAPSPLRNGDGRNNAHVDTKSDSEAETVVLPGKERNSSSPNHRSIKHEGNADNKRTHATAENGTTGGAGKTTRQGQSETNGTPSKFRKLNKDQTATSSNLSSIKSSPGPDALTHSRAGSEESDSKGNSHADGDAISRASHSRKRKIRGEDGDDKPQKRRHVIAGNGDDGAGAPSETVERGVKKASSAGSESPPPRTRQRALSTREPPASNAQRRRKPPPLHVGTRANTHDDDDDGSSNGSTSPRIHAHLKRLTSADASATSPAKMGPYKRTRDKSGRTFLARMCDLGDLGAVRSWLEERPEDLDEADNAKNTPLQIASLKGNHDIVKVLLDAGCKTDCRNVDNDTPLIDAVENGCFEVIKLLLKAGLDPHQKNARGEGLLDLIPNSNEKYDDIKRIILKAQKTERRQSKDSNQSHTGRNSASSRGFRDTSIHSPPPPSASRRRTARSDATRKDLLYINPDKETLLKYSSLGDDEAVHHILSMNPGAADNSSVLAAARGGHETTLELLVALGGSHIDADPDPVQGEKSAPSLRSTPMLAAIGGGKPGIVRLLLDRPGFNATRRWDGKTYYDIAKERRRLHWEEEYKILREAYQRFKGVTSHSDSASAKRRAAENSALSAQGEHKASHPRNKVNSDVRHADARDDSPEGNRHLNKKHLQVPSKTSSREQSVAVSDREATPPRKSSDKKANRSLSEAEVQEPGAAKPRKRLVSKRDLRDSLKQRRSSIASATSSSGLERIESQLERETSQKIKIEEGVEKARPSKSELPKSRTQPRTSSPDSKSDTRRSPDDAKKSLHTKSYKEKALPGRTLSSGPPGGNSGSSKEREGKDGKEGKEGQKAHKPRGDVSVSRSHKSPAPSASKPASPPGKQITRESTPQRDTSDQLQREMQAATADAERRKRREPQSDHERGRAERNKNNDHTEHDAASVGSDSSRKEGVKRKAAPSEDPTAVKKALSEREAAERKAKANQEDAERKTKQEEADSKAKKEEADRKAKAERDEAEKKAKADKEKADRDEAERKAKAEREEAEQKAKAEREAEEARLEKQRQEEEQARRAVERERQRKEEEERQARRQREQEERERLAIEKKQQEEEQRRRDRLPRGLRRLAEMPPEEAKSIANVRRWIPLRLAHLRQLDPKCDKSVEMEPWVSNVQVAGLLGTSDIDFSQYTAWVKRPANRWERMALFKILQTPIRSWAIHPRPKDFDINGEQAYHMTQLNLWRKLTNVFWIRFSDLQDILPRYPHLAGIELESRPIVIEGMPHPKTGQIVRYISNVDDFVENEADIAKRVH